MSRVYIIAPAAFTPGSAKTILTAMAAAEKPFKVRRIELSSDDTGGATVVDVDLLRVTAEGTNTTVTPAPLLQGDAAFSGDAGYNHSAEPTAGTILDRFKWNIQVPFTIVFAPGEELTVPPATDEGIGIEFLDDPGASILVKMEIEEEY